MKRRNLLIMMLLLAGVSIKAQSVSDDQMDERFNGNKLPYGWFAKGWVVKDSVAQRSSQDQTSGGENPESGTPEFSMPSMGGGDSYNYLMTPPLSVKKDEVLSFSAKKGGGDGNALGSFMGDSDSTLVVERAVYGQFKWIKVADFTTEIDSTYKTFTISNTDPGEYRFRFRAGGSVVIDSVAGFHIDMKAPDLYPIYQDKNVKPVDLGLCDKDTTITFSVVNTGTDTLNVNLSLDNRNVYTLELNKVSVAAADTAKFKLTFNYEQARQGRNSVKLTFEASDRNIEKVPLPIDAVVTQENVYVQDFNTTEMPFAWFSEGWEMKENTASVSKVPESMGPLASSNESYFLMTPPLKVRNDKDVLLFSVKKPGGDGGGFDMSSMLGGGDEGSKLVIEKSVYGSNKWEKIKDCTNALDTIYTTQWISSIRPGDYRFRFVATDSIVIDSVAGFQLLKDAPDMYVKVDTVAVRDLDFGLLEADTVKTYNVINTGTGDFIVNAFSSDPRYISLNKDSVILKAGQSEAINAKILNNEDEQGEVLAAIVFQPQDEKIAMKTAGIHAYIIPKDSWQESFEPEYVVEDKTYPRKFPEGWTSTGWEIGQSSGDMMSMFMGGGGGEQPYVASSASDEYELITPRLQAKQGQVLKFNAQAGGGMAAMMSMFGGDTGTPQYLRVYYKRDYDRDWTLYNMYFTSGDVFFKAPYTGYYQLKFIGGGSSVDEFIGFNLPKASIELSEESSDMSSTLQKLDGQMWNVEYNRVISAIDNGDGTSTPVASTVCLPYDFNLDEYYKPGTAKLYQMEYVDTVYNQFIFKEMPNNLMEAGKPYMIVVNSDEVRFNAIGAKITSQVSDGIPVYDFSDWYWNMNKKEVVTWNGTFNSFHGDSFEYVMQENGKWSPLLSGNWISPFRAFFRSVTVNDRSLSTKFFKIEENGSEEVGDIHNLVYLSDFNGSAFGNKDIERTIQTIDQDGTQNYYDLQGRRLNEKPRSGIYIENGKKHVAR